MTTLSKNIIELGRFNMVYIYGIKNEVKKVLIDPTYLERINPKSLSKLDDELISHIIDANFNENRTYWINIDKEYLINEKEKGNINDSYIHGYIACKLITDEIFEFNTPIIYDKPQLIKNFEYLSNKDYIDILKYILEEQYCPYEVFNNIALNRNRKNPFNDENTDLIMELKQINENNILNINYNKIDKEVYNMIIKIFKGNSESILEMMLKNNNDFSSDYNLIKYAYKCNLTKYLYNQIVLSAINKNIVMNQEKFNELINQNIIEDLLKKVEEKPKVKVL